MGYVKVEKIGYSEQDWSHFNASQSIVPDIWYFTKGDTESIKHSDSMWFGLQFPDESTLRTTKSWNDFSIIVSSKPFIQNKAETITHNVNVSISSKNSFFEMFAFHYVLGL